MQVKPSKIKGPKIDIVMTCKNSISAPFLNGKEIQTPRCHLSNHHVNVPILNISYLLLLVLPLYSLVLCGPNAQTAAS